MYSHIGATTKVVSCWHVVQLGRSIVVDCEGRKEEASECSGDSLVNSTEDYLYSMRKH